MKLSWKFLLSATALGLVVAPLTSVAIANASSLPGPIYKPSSNPTVYVLRNGFMHAIASEAMLYDLGYQFNELHVVKHLPAIVGHPVSLVRLPHHSKVYLYSKGQLHWIPSAAMFDALGYRWKSIYTVSHLPAPVGSPVPKPNISPQSIVVLSGFPNVEIGQTKTVTIDALNAASQMDLFYTGNVTLRISGTTNGFALSTRSSGALSSSVTVAMHNGVGTVQLHSPTTPWQSVTLAAGAQATAYTQKFISVPNTSAQVGWRVFDAAGNPVTGLHPATASSTQTFTLEPVNAQGSIVSGTMNDNVNISAEPQFGSCPASSPPWCNVIMAPYMTAKSFSFPYTPYSRPTVFSATPQIPYQAKITSIAPQSSQTSLPVSPRINLPQSIIQTVAGIDRNTKYRIQMQLQTQSGQPITDLPVLQKMRGLNLHVEYARGAGSPRVTQKGRTTLSTIALDKVATNHVYYTYQSGSTITSPNQSPDIISLYGTSPAAITRYPG